MKKIFDNPNEKYSLEFIERFKAKIDTNEKGQRDCWYWIGGKQSKGYGSIGIGNGKTALAHRVAYEIVNKKEIPNHLCVRHSCNCRQCVNPNHLLLGTTADNNRDCVENGRNARGEKNGGSKIQGTRGKGRKEKEEERRAPSLLHHRSKCRTRQGRC